MRTITTYAVLMAAAAAWCAYTAPVTNGGANAPAGGSSTNAGSKLVDIDTDLEGSREFTKPTPGEFEAAIAAMEPSADKTAVALFLSTMKWNLRTEQDVNDLFQRCRDYDAQVVKKPETASYKRMVEYYSKPSNAPDKRTSDRFLLVFPKKVAAKRAGKLETLDATSVYNLDGILAAADSAFTKATERLVMGRFMNWSGTARAKIFMVTDKEQWVSVRKGGGEFKPVQIIMTEDEKREFYIYANPAMRDLMEQAVGYAVAELVLKEYSTHMNKLSSLRSHLPLFYMCGFAADIAGLKSVLTDEGPRQLDRYLGKEVRPIDLLAQMKKAQESGGTDQLPLLANDLLQFDKLAEMTGYPRDNQKLYHVFRQNQATVDYLLKNGPLAFVGTSKELAQGKSLEKAFDSTYVKIRNAALGKASSAAAKEDKSSSKKDKTARKEDKKTKKSKEADTPDDVLKGWKELKSRARDSIFMPLTEMPDAKGGGTAPAPRPAPRTAP